MMLNYYYSPSSWAKPPPFLLSEPCKCCSATTQSPPTSEHSSVFIFSLISEHWLCLIQVIFPNVSMSTHTVHLIWSSHYACPIHLYTLLFNLDPRKEGLVGNVRLKGSLGCTDHLMVEFKILRAARRAHSKLTALDFRRADVSLFRGLLSRVARDKALEGRGAQESCVIFRDRLLQAQERWHPNKEVRQKTPEGCMDEQGACAQTPAQ